MKRIWIFCDGSAGGLVDDSARAGSAIPRSALACGAGSVAFDDDGRIVGWDWRPLPAMSNNEAEYAGLLLGIGLAERLKAEEVVFVLDSATVVGQMTGRCAVNSRRLHPWNWQACTALRQLRSVRFCVVPREWNRLADGLAAQAGISWAWLRGRVEEVKR